MKLLFENWRRYLTEGIDPTTGEPDFKYYAFDWDDNILMMPTQIMLKSEQGQEVPMGTADFAEYRTLIGKEPFDYEGFSIAGFAEEPFRNFRHPTGDEQFIKDSMSAELGPSWDDFVECLNGGSIFAIITARGHHPETLRSAVRALIDGSVEMVLISKLFCPIYKNIEIWRPWAQEKVKILLNSILICVDSILLVFPVPGQKTQKPLS
jgi:hypothetical protein